MYFSYLLQYIIRSKDLTNPRSPRNTCINAVINSYTLYSSTPKSHKTTTGTNFFPFLCLAYDLLTQHSLK